MERLANLGRAAPERDLREHMGLKLPCPAPAQVEHAALLVEGRGHALARPEEVWCQRRRRAGVADDAERIEADGSAGHLNLEPVPSAAGEQPEEGERKKDEPESHRDPARANAHAAQARIGEEHEPGERQCDGNEEEPKRLVHGAAGRKRRAGEHAHDEADAERHDHERGRAGRRHVKARRRGGGAPHDRAQLVERGHAELLARARAICHHGGRAQSQRGRHLRDGASRGERLGNRALALAEGVRPTDPVEQGGRGRGGRRGTKRPHGERHAPEGP